MMSLQPNSISHWTGFLRFTPVVIASVLVCSVVAFSTSALYGSSLYDAPLDKSKTNAHRFTTAWFVFYAGFFPFLSLLHGFLDIGLFLGKKLSPVYALAGSTMFSIGWLVQVIVWFQCEMTTDGLPGYCYQRFLKFDNHSNSASGYVGVSDSVEATKEAFAVLALVGYLVYISFAAVAVHRAKTTRMSSPLMQVKSESGLELHQ